MGEFMRKSNIVLIIILFVLAGIGWATQITGIQEEENSYKAKLLAAEKYAEKELFQKAIAQYEAALQIREEEAVRATLVETYRRGYEGGVVSEGGYRGALDTACALYPGNEGYWEKLLTFCMETNNHTAAYEAYQKCVRAGAEKGKVHELCNEIRYLYKINGRGYTQFLRSPGGNYTVSNGYLWGIMNSAGQSVYDLVYEYIGPISSEGKYLLQSTKGLRVYDGSGVIQANLTLTFEESRAVNGTLIPIRTGDGWTFYDYEQETFFGESYEEVSAYDGGAVAVKKDGKWQLLTGGENSLAQRFDSIKLFDNGEFQYDGVMIASVDGKYGMYDLQGQKLNEFECQDADVFLGEAIAFKDSSGKWGFVSPEGVAVISPSYDEAKSFSNGLAAVRTGELWGFINTQGEMVIPCQFLAADYFTKSGKCMVSVVEGMYNLIELRYP